MASSTRQHINIFGTRLIALSLICLKIKPYPSASRTSIAKQRREPRYTGIRGRWQAERSQRGSGHCETGNRVLIYGTRLHAESRDPKRDMQAAATAGRSHPVIVVKC